MSRKKLKGALHVKSHTQGSSNELSVSVLDAAREKQDARARRGDAPPSHAGRISLFTLGKGTKVHSTPEKDQRIVLSEGVPQPRSRAALPTSAKPSRPSALDVAPARFVPLIVIACALLVLALTVGQAFFQVRDYQQSLADTLAGYIEVINQADDVVIPFDELVMSRYRENSLASEGGPEGSSEALSAGEFPERYRAMESDVEATRAQLEETARSIEELQPSLSDNNDQEAARQALAAAHARLSLFEKGTSILEESLMATEASQAAGDGWKDILDADAAAREATDLLREMNEEQVRASMEQSGKALESLNSAADRMVAAQNAYARLDLSQYLSYINKRIESQQAALSADQAYLARDKTLLEQENEHYNTLEQEAAALARNLKGDPTATVEEVYRSAIADTVGQYEEARLKAANADAFLRDYLGSDAQ